MPRVIHGAGQRQDVVHQPRAHLPFPNDPLTFLLKDDWPGEITKTWDSHSEPVRGADQAVYANILEEGAPGAREGADCGCQFFCCSSSPTTNTAQPPSS